MTIAGVVLAAGAASRFGAAKQLVRLDGHTFVERAVARADEVGLTPIVAVLPSAIDAPAPAITVRNDAPHSGMSRSLQLGLAALPALADAAVVLLADQPTLAAETVLRVLVAAEETERPIVAASAAGRLGPPVLVRRAAFQLANDLDGDAGLRDVMAARPELVAAAAVEAHAPDVDTPADLERIAERCPGCLELFVPQPELPTHEYIGATPACWARFGEVLAREFGQAGYGALHRHTVDAYAAQHPGVDGRRQRQSVALHLIGLCHWIEHGLSGEAVTGVTQEQLTDRRDWPWLEPPAAYRMTALDVLRARSEDEHLAAVRAWAEAVWAAWSRHHDRVRAWAADALQAGG